MKNFCEPIATDHCPVTGLTILSRPEWTNVSFGKGYSGTASLLGDSILLLQGSGYAKLHSLKDSLTFTDNILAEVIPEGQGFVLLEDLSNVIGTSRDARKYFIGYVKKHKRLLSLIFYNASPLLKLSIKLGKRLNIVKFNVEIVDNYVDAVKCAQKVLSESQNKSENSHSNTNFRLHDISDENRSPHKIVSHPDWCYQSEGFSIRFETIYDNVVHMISTGKFKEEDIEPCFRMLNKAARTLNFSTHPIYIVVCMLKSRGTKQKARIGYYKAGREFYKNYPFKMTILYGMNRFVKAAINFNKPFLPFKASIADDLEDALTLINKDKSESKSPIPGYAKKHPDITSGKADKIDQYVNDLLLFIEKIDWGKYDIDQNKSIDPSHPFSRVFDAITLVKWELDDLIMERTRTEEELKQAKETAESASLAKSEFLANMSHELRTPLNHILGFTELVVDKNFGDLNDIQEEYLNDVLSSSKHLLSLINDILDLSKVEAGKLELEPSNCNLKMLLENSLIMIKEKALKHGIRLSNHIDGIPEIITADERKLKQVMYNLLSNAVKFTQDGGEIRLTADLADSSMEKASDQELRAISYELKASQKFVRISVTDNGIGIKHENLEHIFNPFEQVESSTNRRFQGTGLGLSLTKSLVKLHGGKLWAESGGEGKGSTFRFIIPLQV